MGKGIEFVGKVNEAWLPSFVFVFGSDPRSAGGAYSGGTLGAVVGGGRHENRAARDDVCNDFLAGVTGLNHIRSFGVAGDHPAGFLAGAGAYHAADRGADTAEWAMPETGTVG